MKRFAVVLPTFFGATAGWLCSAILFLLWHDPVPIVALTVLYSVTAWDLRWWKELRMRLPLAIFGGGLLLAALRPLTSGRSLFESWTVLIEWDGTFSATNWALLGAVLWLAVVFVTSPRNEARVPETHAGNLPPLGKQ